MTILAGLSTKVIKDRDLIRKLFSEIRIMGNNYFFDLIREEGVALGLQKGKVVANEFNFLGGKWPPCFAACDANADGQVRGIVTDAVYLLSSNFLGGLAPPAPFPECGSGTEKDELDDGELHLPSLVFETCFRLLGDKVASRKPTLPPARSGASGLEEGGFLKTVPADRSREWVQDEKLLPCSRE